MEDDKDFEFDRIARGARELIKVIREDYGEDARLDTFMIIGIINTNEDDVEHEFPVLWSETRKSYVKMGIIRAADLILDDSYRIIEKDDDEDEDEDDE